MSYKNYNIIFHIASPTKFVKNNFKLHGASNRLSLVRQMA